MSDQQEMREGLRRRRGVRVNPKKDRSERRARAGYPTDEDYDFKTWETPQGVGMPMKRVTRYCATRCDGATVTRKSPSEMARLVEMARGKRDRRMAESYRKGRVA